MYEEEEEGYVSGDYEDMPFELVKIRVKVCSLSSTFPFIHPLCFAVAYRDDVRGMALTPEMPFEEFLERVTSKFGKTIDGLGLKFKDEDGTTSLSATTLIMTWQSKPHGRVPRASPKANSNSGVVTSKPGVVSFNLQALISPPLTPPVCSSLPVFLSEFFSLLG